ncbi:MAG: hypothetical protein NZ898_11885 [Myxococcota bacterium]|nr:hypothetical protein [Myxococcota bacterium]MDW8363386.1 YXWGXW repeat-containing protein [Myxococcales bacterium]
MPPSYAAAVSLVLVLGGCGAGLREHVRERRALGFPADCGQGPYDVETRAEGARWGEGVVLVACVPRPVRGWAELWIDEQRATSGPFGRSFRTRSGAVEAGPAQNARCLASPLHGAEVGGSAVGDERDGGVAPSDVTDVDGETVADVPVLVPLDVAVRDPDSACDDHGLHRVEVLRVALTARADEPHAFPPGTRLRVRIWSQEPNDWSGAFLAFYRVVVVPDDEEQWRERLERERDAERRASERDERRRLACAQRPEDAGCREANAPRTDRPAGASAQTRPASAPPPPRAERRPPRPSANAEWIPGHWRWNGETWIWLRGFWRVPESDLTAGLTTRAPEPPPPVRSETPPSVPPVAGAVWIAGHWQWSGSGWIWVEGSWRLPPRLGLRWRPDQWRLAGDVAVFLPGGWH